MENKGIQIKVGRSKKMYFAFYSENESSQPNSVPTYRVYTSDGTYFMHMYQSDIDRYRVR
jgi:hypothetical protein